MDMEFDWGPFGAILEDYRSGRMCRRDFVRRWAGEQERQMSLYDLNGGSGRICKAR